MKPMFDRVLIREHESEKISPGGIIIPDTAGAKQRQLVEVIAIGPDVEDLSVGDNVVYGQFAGMRVDYNGEPHLLMRSDDVWFITNEGVEIQPVEVEVIRQGYA